MEKGRAIDRINRFGVVDHTTPAQALKLLATPNSNNRELDPDSSFTNPWVSKALSSRIVYVSSLINKFEFHNRVREGVREPYRGGNISYQIPLLTY